MMRKVVFNYMPSTFQRMIFTKTLAYRPQISFLPRVENRGTGAAVAQKESKRYQREMEKARSDRG
jgi:hypothetical protein